MNKKFLMVLIVVMAIALLVPVVASAAPATKINADTAFMAAFKAAGPMQHIDYTAGDQGGVKIPSNAHFADYGSVGFWFVWSDDFSTLGITDAKQKMNGFCVVEPKLFDTYQSVTLTAKSTNDYQNITITEPGIYDVSKWVLKNANKGEAGGYQDINWITVSFTNNPPPVVPQTPLAIPKTVDGVPFQTWALTYDGDLAELVAGMQFSLYSAVDDSFVKYGEFSAATGLIDFGNVDPGSYYVVEKATGAATDVFDVAADGTVTGDAFVVGTDPIGGESLSYVSGKDFGTPVYHDGTGVNYDLPGVWDRTLAGQPAYEAMKALGAQWVWDIEDTYMYGNTGSVYQDEFTFSAGQAGSATLYFAADNAAVVYVNGKLAGYTTVAFDPANGGMGEPAEDLADFSFADMQANIFNGGWSTGWNYSYSVDFDYAAGDNTVTIIAANSAHSEEGPNASYNEQSNPCGLLFGFEIPGVTFDNTLKVTPQTLDHTVTFWLGDEPLTFETVADGMLLLENPDAAEALLNLGPTQEFKGWKDGEGNAVDPSVFVDPVYADADYYAIVEDIGTPPIQYTVNFWYGDDKLASETGDDGFTLAENPALAESLLNLDSTHVFVGWKDGEGNLVDPGVFGDPIHADADYYAVIDVYYTGTWSGNLEMQGGNNTGTLSLKINGDSYEVGPVKAQQNWSGTFNLAGFTVKVETTGNSNKAFAITVTATTPNTPVVITDISVTSQGDGDSQG